MCLLRFILVLLAMKAGVCLINRLSAVKGSNLSFNGYKIPVETAATTNSISFSLFRILLMDFPRSNSDWVVSVDWCWTFIHQICAPFGFQCPWWRYNDQSMRVWCTVLDCKCASFGKCLEWDFHPLHSILPRSTSTKGGSHETLWWLMYVLCTNFH